MTVDDVKKLKYIKKKKKKLLTSVTCRIRTSTLSPLHSLASQIQIKPCAVDRGIVHSRF